MTSKLGVSPHKCNQVEVYNIPTIFNTLMFGLDQSKVSEDVRESFSKIKERSNQQNDSKIRSARSSHPISRKQSTENL